MTFLSTIETSPVFQISGFLHRLCHMHRSKITLNSGSDVVILNSKLQLKYRSRILMQLEEFLDFTWQVSQIQQELVSFTNPHINQLVNNHRSIKHGVKGFDFCFNFTDDIQQVFCVSFHSKLQTLLTVAQGLRSGHQTELLSDQPKKLEPIGFCDSSRRNLGTYQVLNLAVARELLLQDVE